DFEVGIAGETHVELHSRPVPAEIGDLSELPEGNRVGLSPLVAQLDGAQREALHRSLGFAAVDIFADPEGVLGEVEDARYDVAHKRLAAERHREAEDGSAGDERRDIDAEGRKRGENRPTYDEHE